MGAENQPTCGQGLAEHSALPAKLGELTAAVAANLEQELLALLEQRVTRDRQMLAAMGAARDESAR
jgi:hypothetical protein